MSRRLGETPLLDRRVLGGVEVVTDQVYLLVGMPLNTAAINVPLVDCQSSQQTDRAMA